MNTNNKSVMKWSPILENLGVPTSRIGWLAEYAEFHSINENAYANASNVAGMGNVLSAQPSGLPGQTLSGGSNGSGDLGQNLLPVAMKIAAQTIGLDLVAVKPTPGPKIDLVYVDFNYDDTRLGEDDERPQVIKVKVTGAKADDYQKALDLAVAKTKQTQGGLANGPWYTTINAAITNDPATDIVDFVDTVPGNKEGWVEFLGLSRIDGYPMFRVFRQYNTAHTVVGTGTPWQFDQTRNTFAPTGSMASQITAILNEDVSGGVEVTLVSALEDHIPGFSSNWKQGGDSFTGAYAMTRGEEEDTYPGVIGPNVLTKTIQVGTIQVSSALRRTEIEDIKANTGMDIVQKMESVLVNELSQTISKQIVAKVFELGTLNRATAPKRNATDSIFDFNTADQAASLGGETSHAIQRKLITKVALASNYIATEGRVGPAQYLVTNGALAATLQDIAGYTVNPVSASINPNGQLYPVGKIGDISIYVDPYMRYDDNRIAVGRKNDPDQPGLIFVPYLLAQSISVIAESTFAPRLLLRSRYAIAEVGWFPQKQFMVINVTDNDGLLN